MAERATNDKEDLGQDIGREDTTGWKRQNRHVTFDRRQLRQAALQHDETLVTGHNGHDKIIGELWDITH